MIIKKKYTTIKKISENSPEETINIPVENNQEENFEAEPQNIQEEEITPDKTETPKKEEKEEKEKKKKKNIEDLDLTIENIKFEQREERREGTRRRGYRRSQDRNIVSRAQKDAEVIKENAKQEGYQAGIDNATKDIEEFRANFAEFFKYKEEVFNKVSECIMDISVEIAKKIINKTVETDREYIIPIIHGVVEEINKTDNKIILKVMPKDVEIVKDRISEIFSDNYFEAAISVIPDKEIKDGGVIVETSNGLIDASIETQLAIIEKAFCKKEDNKEENKEESNEEN